MKKILFVILTCIWSVVSMYAWDRNILVSTKNTSLLFAAQNDGDLRFAYYGDKITPDQINQIHDIWAGLNRPAYPTFGSEYSSATALQVVHSDGNMTLDLIVKDVTTKNVENGEQTVVTLRDKHYPFEVKMNYKAYNNSDIIEMWAEISHTEKKVVVLKRFDSGCMPIRRGDVWISHLHGSWIAESDVTSEPLKPGMKTIKNMDGARNGQGDHAEIMFSLDGRPQENTGRMIGAALCWSGNYKLRIDTDNNYSHNFLAGINDEASEYKLEPKEVFVTPKLAFTYSEEGLSGVSRNFHRWARNGQIHGGNKLRDILLNSWEGVYFDIDEQKMDQMMGDFAAMGGELFVMDDGWFGDKYPRNNDHSSLGDWVVNRRKLPNGVDGLIATAKKHGIKFGIWIEPESANTVSELYEKHPDWVLKVPNRDPRYGRGGTQMLLDLSNPEVQDFVFQVVDDLMTNYPDIAYIKWDANASLVNYGSPYLPKDKQSHIYIDFHRGLQKAVERIRAKYPDLVMQACGGGGGRVDYGVMPGFDEFWVSDNTDALQRIFMQWGTSYFYPSMAMAQHVSASPNHQTGRVIPLKFRFDVAMSGRLGMEIQPNTMSDGEKEFSKHAIATYKEIRPVVQFGDLYRLISPFDKLGVASLMYCTPEKDRAVFFAYKIEHYMNQVLPRFRMAGLDANKNYRIRELNLPQGENPCYLHDKVVAGSILMSTGMEVPLGSEYASRVFELIEVK
ncbi:alpha-galactosidase [Bacteroides difficilis]|uniref:alpha-galactosidase n=1 Tax=Bacteroides difficilis TaxID=2763021 RepID=UPI003AAFB5E3